MKDIWENGGIRSRKGLVRKRHKEKNMLSLGVGSTAAEA